MNLLGIGVAVIVVGFILMLADSRDIKTLGVMAFVVGVLFLLGFGVVKAFADEAPKPSMSVGCWAIRKAVQNYGEATLIDWARARGVSEKEIEAGRKCLKR